MEEFGDAGMGLDNGGGGCGFLHIDDGWPPIRYDAPSLDIGSSPKATHQSIMDHPCIIPVKPIAIFCAFYQQLQARFQTALKAAVTIASTPCLL